MHGILPRMISGFLVVEGRPYLTIYFVGGKEGYFRWSDGKPLTKQEVDSGTWAGEDIEPTHYGGAMRGGKTEAMRQKKKLRKKPHRKDQRNESTAR